MRVLGLLTLQQSVMMRLLIERYCTNCRDVGRVVEMRNVIKLLKTPERRSQTGCLRVGGRVILLILNMFVWV
jgi:hypothetical protein